MCSFKEIERKIESKKQCLYRLKEVNFILNYEMEQGTTDERIDYILETMYNNDLRIEHLEQSIKELYIQWEHNKFWAMIKPEVFKNEKPSDWYKEQEKEEQLRLKLD